MSATATLSPKILGVSPVRSKARLRRKPVTALAPVRSRPTAKPDPAPDFIRTSEVLKSILTKNPDLEFFTVEKIISEIGTAPFGTTLMFFAIPEVIPIPIPGVSALVVLPTGYVSYQMATGRRQIKLPKFLLNRVVPRKALAAAIHAVLPALKKAEKVSKPRWKWASTPAAQRLLGLFIFILALAIAFPLPGFNMPQAIAIFIIGLGLVEKDGLLICAGVVLGIASLLLLGTVVLGLSSLLGF